MPHPVEVTLVGIATFDGTDGFGPATFTAFTLPAAQRYLAGGHERVTSILVHAAGGVVAEQLAERVQPVLPRGVEAIQGARVTNENIDDINATFLGFFQTFLLVFALIALLVATFSIFNSFSILVAQRTRESALLRALGATAPGRRGRSSPRRSPSAPSPRPPGWPAASPSPRRSRRCSRRPASTPCPPAGSRCGSARCWPPSWSGSPWRPSPGVAPAIRAGRVAPLAALREAAVEATAVARRRVVAGVASTAIGVALVLSACVAGTLRSSGSARSPPSSASSSSVHWSPGR